MSEPERAYALLFGVMFVAACASPPPNLQTTPPPSQGSAPAASASSAQTSLSAEPLATSVAPVASAIPNTQVTRPKPVRSIACGPDLYCDAVDEVCCGDSGPSHCAKLVVSRDATDYPSVGKQIGECGEGFPTFCDDSSDCDAGQGCCSGYFTSDRDIVGCSSACEYDERCEAGGRCNTPDTTCVAGTCRPKNTHVSCGGVTCGGAKPICCVDDSGKSHTCGDHCEGGRAYMCNGPRDCPAGKSCQGGSSGTWCSGLVDVANATVLCEKDSDCPSNICMGSPGKPSCKRGPTPRSCGCSPR